MNNNDSAPGFGTKNRIFNHKNNNLGKLVQKYNIVSANIENYFIETANLEGYELARLKQDLGAHKKFGRRIMI